jgi:hypothetical protein
VVIALLIGVGSCVAFLFIYSDLVYTYRTCADGWASSSIGRPGACSHHGGVVTKTVDKRTVPQKILSYGLGVVGSASLLFVFVLAVWTQSTRAIPIEGDWATVPLKIANETRYVEVLRLNENTYMTVNDVALVRCPERRRKSVFKRPIEFRGKNGKFKPDLFVWIYTGRGRAGGYKAKAFMWCDDLTEGA